MPAARPRAAFEPIPPDFDVRALVESTENFQYVDRISWHMIEEQGMDQFEKLVLLHVVIGGKPLVVDGFEEHLDPWTFTPQWLRDNHGQKVENARNLATKENLPLTIGHYLKNMGPLAEQFFLNHMNYKDKKRQRIYLKDIDCPPVWHDKVREVVPAGLFYLNESTGEVGGLGAVDDPSQPVSGRRKGRGLGPAGDLMSCLPEEMRAENLMCYIGHEGTYTPSHREMCASLGQNIMVEASGAIGEDGKPEKPGSSIWFMTETKHRHLVAEYWLSVLGHDIEVENHFAQIQAWVHAPFKTYVVEQRPGDFILIPPLAPHQVWNRGTRTTKVAWNRTTVETLEMAMREALPNARLVCRDEQYKNKAIVYYTLNKYANLLKSVKAQCDASPQAAYEYGNSIRLKQIKRAFKRLFDLYKQILLSEMFNPDAPKEHPEFLPFDSNVTCAYCRGNIFNRFLTCKTCTKALGTDTDEPYDICMECYAMGRSCACVSDLKWCEQWRWKDLMFRYEEWRRLIIEFDGGVNETTPQPIQEERRYYGKRTLAQICQTQLRLRPWVDPNNPKPLDEESDEAEIEVNDDGTVKKAVKKHSKTFLQNHKTCHVCLHRHAKWKMANCSFCESWWCYGTLFRAHDLMPQTVMEDLHWQCPHCKRRCNTGRCRHDPRQKPYEPKGTLLGHDTRKVADVRSVEALVDFGVSNLNWIKDGNDPLNSARFQNRRDEAERADVEEDFEDENGIHFSTREGDDAIDPALRGPEETTQTATNGDRAQYDVHDEDGEHEPDSPNGMHPRSARIEEAHIDDFEGSTIYGDPEVPASGKKRKRASLPFKLAKSTPRPRKKKKKADDDAEEEPTPTTAASGASKEFLKQQEKQQLDVARQANRYVIVWAAMKNKKKVVTLNLDPEILSSFQAQEQARRRSLGRPSLGLDGTLDGRGRVILQSDVKAPSAPDRPAAAAGKTAPNQFRYRVEEDADFKSRRRSDRPAEKSKAKDAFHYEEIDIPSDEEDFAEEYAPQPSRRRRGSEDLQELPENFKDGQVSASRRQTIPGGAGAQIRPPKHTVRKKGKFVSNAYLKAQDEAARQLAQEAAAAMEVENRNAKLDALDILDDNGNAALENANDEEGNLFSSGGEDAIGDIDNTSASAPAGFTAVNTPKAGDLAGRKFKIVSATTTTKNGAAAESSDDDDEIPARNVPQQKITGSAPLRGIVPTRGKTTPTRGRGRPPKRAM